MASGIFAILDDIAALMDDVALASKIATQKTAGILGDDLAVNAEKATGFVSSREIPVLWAITKGSFLNKLIIVPIALLLNFYFPIIMKYILIAGGIYLAFEGVEKIIEWFFKREEVHEENSTTNALDTEKAKVGSAVKTDFILSIEIVIIALSTVLDKTIMIQIFTVSVISIVATVGVYGIVALIVRMDDAGYSIMKNSKKDSLLNKIGQLLVNVLPYVIKALGYIGTAALILVSGGIFEHNVDYFHHLDLKIPTTLLQIFLGLGIGSIAVAIYTLYKKVIRK